MNLHSFCFKFLKRNPKWSVANFFLILLNYPLEIVVISYLSGQIFSRINNIKTTYNSVFFLFILIFITYFVLETSITIKDKVDEKYFPKMEREVRLNIVDLILNKVKINYDNVQTGEVIARLLKAPTFVGLFYTSVNKYVVPFFITFAIVIVYLFFLNPKMGGIGAVSIVIYLVIFFFMARYNIRKASKRELKENVMLEDVDDTLNNSLSIMSTGQSKLETARLNKIHDEYDIKLKQQLKSSNLTKWVSSILNICLFGVLIFSALYFYKKNELSSAATISLITMSLFLVKHLRVLSRRVCEGLVFYGTLRENNDFIQSLKTNTIEDGKLQNIPITGEIRFENITFYYPNSKKPILQNVSFRIQKNEKVAIIGKSGSGKSTILKLILGFYKANKGQITFNNIPIDKIERDYLRSNISIVNQNVKLFNRTIIENIAYGTNIPQSQIIQQLKRLNILQVFHNLPNNLQTRVGKYGDKLSGGQKQIIYLLRCYFRQNPIIILDEPTSSIDDFHKKFVLQMIKELTKKSTLIIVSHDPTIYNMFHRKIHINQGRLISDTNSSNIFSGY